MSTGLVTQASNGTGPDHRAEFKEGVELLKNGYAPKALEKLQRAFECDKHNPYYMSFLGLSIARALRKWAQASEFCEEAVRLKPGEIQFHLNLGEVYASAGQRERSLHTLDYALGLFKNDSRLTRARNKIEKRRAPLLPFLERGHFLNRELGKLRHRILKHFD